MQLFSQTPTVWCFLFEGALIFFFPPLNNFLFRQQEADTEAQEKHSARSGLYELA